MATNSENVNGVESRTTNGTSTEGPPAEVADLNASQLFDKGAAAVIFLESTDAASSDDVFRRRVAEGVRDLEWSTLAVSHLDLFSDNEAVEELPTSSLKFLLLPGYLGWLTNKKPIASGAAGRRRLVNDALEYYEDFLGRLKNYGVYHGGLPSKRKAPVGGAAPAKPDLAAMTAEREAKIRRFKEGKERDRRLEAFEERRRREALSEEDERLYWTEALAKWSEIAEDDSKSLVEEKEILAFMESRGGKEKTESAKKEIGDSKNPFAGKTFILTRDDIQKKVFGMGYPSLPTMTVEEWYEEQASLGLLPTPGESRAQIDAVQRSNDSNFRAREEERKKEDEERKEDEDDEEERAKKREWDEWKDDHRRGWGNRKNMG